MPKLRKELEDKILWFIKKEYTNIEVAEKTGVHRKTVAQRRKAWENRDPDKEKPEIEEEIIRPEQPEAPSLQQQILTLMEEQGTYSAYEAISRAIEIQSSFNPYLLKYGLKTPAELIAFFEDKIKEHAPLEQDFLEQDPYNFPVDLMSIEEKLKVVEDRFWKDTKQYDAARYIVQQNRKIPKDEQEKICQEIPISNSTLQCLFTELKRIGVYPSKTLHVLDRRSVTGKP